MIPRTIRKRDGVTVQAFDDTKIRNAVRAAWKEVRGDVSIVETNFIVEKVLRLLPEEGEVGIEKIQDLVEVALMQVQAFDVAKAYILYRHERAEARELRGKKPDPNAIKGYIHASKYARYIPYLGRREVYHETVSRVERMHLQKFPAFEERIRWAFDRVREEKVLPSMRSMQFAGDAILNNHCRINNCSFTHIDRLRAFSEAMFLLLCGCGVGYSIQHDHVEKLPPIGYVNSKKIRHHVVADTIEGWADAVEALFQGFQDGVYIEFAYHLIRPAGSPLVTSGGKAPGHTELKKSLERVRGILEGAQGRNLRPIECHRILCILAEAPLSGGVRRSAMIALFSLDDSEMMNVKTGDWYAQEPWLANANNSVALLRGSVRERQFKRIFEMTRQWGEPGFYFTNDLDYGTNPCVPAGTRVLTRIGYFPIDKLVGNTVIVWNGVEWSQVVPAATGRDQPMVRVHLSDGTFLDCTDGHWWSIALGKWSRDHIEERVQAKDLQAGDTLLRYDMPVVEAGDEMPYAYTHGFWCADGVLEDGKRKAAQLYGVKKSLIGFLDTVRVSPPNEAQDRIRVVLPEDMPDKFVVPTNAALSSRLEWFAGLLDGDGTTVKNPNSVGLQLTSIHLDFLREVRLMLTTLGVQAKIAPMSDGGYRPMPNGKGGYADYLTQPCWRLLVNATDTHRLVSLGLKTHRLDLTLAKELPQRDARRFVHVEAVERLPNADVVYCFTEKKNHTGTFEGVVTGQCSEIGLNPKLAIDTKIQTKLAKRDIQVAVGEVFSGWAFCNLCEINAAKLKTLDDFMDAAHAATIIGTLQATYTSYPYLGWISEAIAEREALLGIGMTGMLDSPEVACDPANQRAVANRIKLWNREYASILGIEASARLTCIKPSGTTSLELGCVASGHHAHHARRYIRRVIADELEFIFQEFRKINPHMCVRKPDGKWVIEFPVEAPPGAIVKADLGAIQFLKMIKSTQQNWVIPGTGDGRYSPGLTHNVSNTVQVAEGEWGKVADYLWENRDYFTGVSLLPDIADKRYPFAPHEEIQTPADEARWNVLVGKYRPVDYEVLKEVEDGTDLKSEAACAGDACSIV